MLTFNPYERITCEQALEHKYFKDFHKKKDEIVMMQPITVPMNDNIKFSIEEYRNYLYFGGKTD